MEGTHVGFHVRCFVGEVAYDLLGSPAPAHFLFQIGQSFDEEKGRDAGSEEIVEPNGLIRIQRLQKGLIENEHRLHCYLTGTSKSYNVNWERHTSQWD